MKKRCHSISLVGISFLLISCSSLAMAQYTNEQSNTTVVNLPEVLWPQYFGAWENKLVGILHTDSADLQNFFQYCSSELNKDKGSFFTGFSTKIIWLDSTGQFFDSLDNKYIGLYNQYISNPKPLPVKASAPSSCNPACSNIGFQNGTLSSWSAFWAVDASTVSTINTAHVTGGACASVTQDAMDPNTNTYQVSLMPASGSDPIAGPLIPYSPPLGGTCAMIGDGPTPGAGVGILQQSFTVSASNPLLTLQYAVMLENPNHPGYEQPWFQIQVLDENGNEIPGCGQYLIVSGAGIPGFIPLNYAAGGDTIYCKQWTTAFVPLNNYIGQCVTVVFTASDCALGGHFGYAYVAASCDQPPLISSSTVFCTGQRSATVTGPPGGAVYQWTTTDGCISGSNAQAVLHITCAGTYTLITSSSAGANCSDTFSITIPHSTSGPPPVPCFTVGDTVCSGDTLHIDASCSFLYTMTKYYWDFYDNGQYEDSSGANPQWTYTAPGNYDIRLHEVAANGCSADTVIQTVVESTTNYGLPDVTVTTTNASACGKCDGGINFNLLLSSVTVGISITNSCDPSFLIQISPNGSERITGGCGGESIGAGHITTKCNTVCPGTCYYYITPLVPVPPTKCAPGGFTGDTIAANISVNNVNLAISQTTVPATCRRNNGSASISVSGGTAPYTYSWPAGLGNDSSVIGLKSGSYMVTVTDSAGCNKSFTVTIDSLNNLSASAVPYYVSCFGANNGAIKIQTVGGNSPYTYNWLPNISNTDSAGGLAPGSYSVTVTDTAGCSGTVATQITQPTKITAFYTGNYINLPCYTAGYVTANAIGGYPPYAFNWSDSTDLATDSGLTAGVYTVTITDANQCSITGRVNVIQSGGLDTVSVSIIPAGTVLLPCSDTSITFAAIPINGGTTPVYQWLLNGNNVGNNSSSFSSDSLRDDDVVSCILTSGLPCVTGSPATSNSVKIKVSPDFQGKITPIGSDSICPGASKVLTLPGDSVPVQWQSSTAGNSFSDIPGATGSSYNSNPTQTTYFRIYEPHSVCPDTSGIFQLIVKQAPVPPQLMAPDSIFCAGDSVQVCALGTFASYSWNTGDTTSCITVKQAGNYWVSVDLVGGCPVGSPHQDIKVYPVSSISIIEQGDTLSSFGAVSYQWFLDGKIINGANASFYVARQPGSYSVEITDSYGCLAMSSPVVVTGERNLSSDMIFEVYPNPASNDIQIEVAVGWISKEYEFYDVCGKLITAGVIRNEKSIIDISAIAKGVYFIKVNGFVRKFMKL